MRNHEDFLPASGKERPQSSGSMSREERASKARIEVPKSDNGGFRKNHSRDTRPNSTGNISTLPQRYEATQKLLLRACADLLKHWRCEKASLICTRICAFR